MPGITNPNTVLPDPQDTLRSTGISLKYKHYAHGIKRAQALGISFAEFVRLLFDKDIEAFEEYTKEESNKSTES